MAFQTEYIQIDGSLNVDGSIFQNGVEFTGGAVTTYNNASADRILTSGGAGIIDAESTLTYDGSILSIGNQPTVSYGTMLLLSTNGQVEMRFNNTDIDTAWTMGTGCTDPTDPESFYIHSLKTDGFSSKTYVDINPQNEEIILYGQITLDDLSGTGTRMVTTSSVGSLSSTAIPLTVANGGTGQTTLGSDYVLTGTGTSGITAEANLRFSGSNLSLYSGAAENIKLTNTGTIDASGIITAATFRTVETNTNYNIITRDNDGNAALYVQQVGNTIGAIASFQYGDGYVGAGTEVMSVKKAGVTINGTLSVYSGATEKIRLTNTGYIYADQDIVAYSTLVSDERLKENVFPLSNSLDKILQLEGISYNRINNDDKRVHLGFIAQQVEPIIPEVVIEQILPLTGDEETLYKTINYTEIIPHIVEGMKEQQQIINDQQKEIDDLKQKVEFLLSKI